LKLSAYSLTAYLSRDDWVSSDWCEMEKQWSPPEAGFSGLLLYPPAEGAPRQAQQRRTEWLTFKAFQKIPSHGQFSHLHLPTQVPLCNPKFKRNRMSFLLGLHYFTSCAVKFSELTLRINTKK